MSDKCFEIFYGLKKYDCKGKKTKFRRYEKFDTIPIAEGVTPSKYRLPEPELIQYEEKEFFQAVKEYRNIRFDEEKWKKK